MPHAGFVRIPLELDPAQLARVDALAKELAATRAALLRIAIEEHLQRHRPWTMEEEIAAVRARYGYEKDHTATCSRGIADCGTFNTGACGGCER